ncbi:DUF4435 domain-containing protein [Methylobacterium goesingense]|uniref:DUF4435 domain-containing protein n=1 Tax=Methylobacterium goesingense TaxID=243690 RepID=A0ABV2LA43_9HYPH|nr:DUF4435 domain-containing protein [Methylobacterium goesingense]GJD74240.1 hypothetical protein CFIICLFH_2474 [Methylobacterium goesingense]
MIDFAELLIKEQSNVNATVLEFINSEYKSDDVIVFFEGVDDPPFYFDFLSSHFTGHALRIYTCGGKKAMAEVKSFIDDYELKINPHKILYLRDRDFDEFNNKLPNDMFVTKYYSIESYFAEGAYIRYLIEKFIPTAIKGGARDNIVSSIDSTMAVLARNLLAPMALFCHMRAREVDVELQKLSISDFSRYNSNEDKIVKERNRIEKIARQIKSDDFEFRRSDIVSLCKCFKAIDYKYWIKGKIALQMLRMSVKYVAAQIGGTKQISLESLLSKIGSYCFSQSRPYLEGLPELNAYLETA